jgi:quinol monooxygenase YgiN
MSVQVIIELQTDRGDDVKKFFRDVLPDTRGFEGFETLSIAQSDDDPASFVLVEQWASRASLEAYLAWRMETGVLNELVSMVKGAPSIRVFNFVGV